MACGLLFIVLKPQLTLASVCIIAVLRLYYLYRATVSTDLTYDNVAPATWSSIELNVAIMCASVPALRPVISVMFPRFISTVGSKTSPSHLTGFTAQNQTHRSNAYYQPNESAVELSHTMDGGRDADALSSDSASHDNTIGTIHVKQDWSITQEDMVYKGAPHAR